jgi:hypothetical protein
MVNKTFIGNVYFSDSTSAHNNVKYQGLFYSLNTQSFTKWDTPLIIENNQYNINLGDSDWLGNEGKVLPGDKVILCFWSPITSDRNDIDLVEWCFIEHTITLDDTYIQDIQLNSAELPTCSFSLSGSNVNEPIYIFDTGTHNNYSYIAFNEIHFQNNQYNNIDIFEMNTLSLSAIDISWDDGTFSNNLPLSASPFNHIYTTPNDYNISITATNYNSLSCNILFNTHITYSVNNGLVWTQPVYIDETTSFMPEITGDVLQISGVDYYVDGVLKYENRHYSQGFDIVFDVSNDHTVKQCIKYFDGFTNQIQCQDFYIIMASITNFSSQDYQCGKKFINTSVVGKPPIINYQWDITDGSFVLAHTEGSIYNEFYYAWPYPGTFHVRLAITDSNNNISSVTKVYVVDKCSIAENSGSGGMGGSLIEHKVYIDKPLPIVNIIYIEDEEIKNKEIDVIKVIDMDLII